VVACAQTTGGGEEKGTKTREEIKEESINKK
jgi:hypothetical protein